MVKVGLLVRLEAKPGKDKDVDAFPDEAGRSAHLSGGVAKALAAKADELFARSPVIEKVDVKFPKSS
ncbi:MAG TPA: hypothetical protein VIG37_06560 [Methylomirabilota bacterium]|jgi:hypothetical protein